MRTPESYLTENLKYLVTKGVLKDFDELEAQPEWQACVNAIESAQKEAWNEAIEAAAKVGYKRLYDIGEYEELVEAAILKLKR